MNRRDNLKIMAGAALVPATALTFGRAYAQAVAVEASLQARHVVPDTYLREYDPRFERT